jgi:prepilin-type N-terminal cleavage/methylation domain-containing protein
MKQVRFRGSTLVRTSKSKGFTLIELLVVIAIIGLLASIILASLNTARNKGADATTQGNFDNIRTQSQLFYSNQSPNAYATTSVVAVTTPATTACAAATTFLVDPNVAAEITSTLNAEGANTVYCSYTTGAAAWMIAATEKTGGYWCVDSTGVEKQEAGSVPAVSTTACP